MVSTRINTNKLTERLFISEYLIVYVYTLWSQGSSIAIWQYFSKSDPNFKLLFKTDMKRYNLCHKHRSLGFFSTLCQHGTNYSHLERTNFRWRKIDWPIVWFQRIFFLNNWWWRIQPTVGSATQDLLFSGLPLMMDCYLEV